MNDGWDVDVDVEVEWNVCVEREWEEGMGEGGRRYVTRRHMGWPSWCVGFTETAQRAQI